MKLLEVLGRPERSEENIADYQNRLRDERIRHLASGAYASVYQHPKHKTMVVKVGEEEKGALSWLKFAAQNQDNPYVPKIYDIRRYKRGKGVYHSDSYFIVFLERLTEYFRLPKNARLKIIQKHLGPFVDPRAFSYDYLNDLVGDEKVYRELVAQHRQYGVPSQHLLNVFRFLMRPSKHGGDYDVRDANIMLRGKDQIVFTDPLE